METFTIRDKNTGMVVNVRGNSPPPVEALPQIFGKARQRAEESLASGTYGFDDNFQKLSKEQLRDKTRKLAAQAIGTSPEDVDIDTGMGLWERTKLDMLPDEPSRMEYLEKKYGQENVNMLNIGGKPKMFVRDPKTKKMTMVDEMGASLADFTADIAGEAVTTAGAVGGAIAGTAVAPGVGTVAGATGGAALGGFLTGVTQDVAAEVATGQDIELGQKVKRRGLEAAIGVPIDLATAGLAKGFTRLSGKVLPDAARDEVIGAFKRTGERFKTTLRPTTAQEVGEEAAERESLRAAKGGIPQRELELQRTQVGFLYRLLQGERPARTLPQAFEDYMDQTAGTVAALRSSSEVATRELGDLLDQKIARNLGTLRPKSQLTQSERGAELQQRVQEFVLIERGGQPIRGIEGGIEGVSRELYETAYEATPGDIVPLIGIRDTVKSALRKMNLPTDLKGDVVEKLSPRMGPQAAAVVDEINRRVGFGGNIDLRQFDNYIQEIARSAKFNSKTRGPNERAAATLYRSLESMRDKLVKQVNPDALPLFKRADRHFKSNVLPTREGELERILGTLPSGQYGLQGEQVIDAAVGSSTAIRRILDVTNNNSQVRQLLRDAYLDKVVTPTSVKFDPSIVKALWRGEKIQSLDRINSILKGQKSAMSAKSEDELRKVLSAMAGNEQDAAIQAFRRARAADEELAKQMKRKLFRLASKEPGQLFPQDADKFVDALLTATPGEIDEFLKKIPVESQRAFRQASFDRLIQNAQSGAVQRAGSALGGEPLWNPDALADALTKSRAKWNTLLGEKNVDALIDLNTILKSASEITQEQAQLGLRAGTSLGPGGTITPYALISGSIPAWVWRKLVNVAYGSNTLRPLIKGLKTKRTFDDELFRKWFAGLAGTRRGVQALTNEMDADPEFAAFMEQNMEPAIPEE